MIDEGDIDCVDGACVVNNDLSSVRIPASLRSGVAARIDKLPPVLQRVLKVMTTGDSLRMSAILCVPIYWLHHVRAQ